MVENKFNLIDEPWIPVVNIGQVSLREIFSNFDYHALGGNPIQKIALTKLLLAIAQSAYTPENLNVWKNTGIEGISKKCLDYLDKWHDHFWLYGTNPFLQIPSITELITQRKEEKIKEEKKKGKKEKEKRLLQIEAQAKPKSIGAGFYPDLSAANNPVLTQSQFPAPLTDAEKALFILSLMNFSLGGKRIEKELKPLSENYIGKTVSAKPGPSLGNKGYTHTFLLGETLLHTVWFNLLTKDDMEEKKFWKDALGVAPWEVMPTGEDCHVAKKLKNSYMGCLLAMSRFILLQEDGIYYLEGIQYLSHKKGWREPSLAINDNDVRNSKALQIDPEKRPWRELTSLLSLLSTNNSKDYDCNQIRYGLERIRMLDSQTIYVWSGGLKVSDKASDQSVKGKDDFVESTVRLDSSCLGEIWYQNLSSEINTLNKFSILLEEQVIKYFKSQNMNGKAQAKISTHLFWQLCEHKFQTLVDLCNQSDSTMLKIIRKVFVNFVFDIYNAVCPKETARQLDAWAKNKPNLEKYLR